MRERYSKEELNRALDLVEQGSSFQMVVDEFPHLNKSIIAREMRKRKNLKADANIEVYRKFLEQDNGE